MKKTITGNSESMSPKVGTVLDDIGYELNAANRAFDEERYSESVLSAFRAVKIARKRKKDMGLLKLSELRKQLMKGEELSTVRNRIEHGNEGINKPQMTHKLLGGRINCADTGVVDLSGATLRSSITLPTTEEDQNLSPQELHARMMQKKPVKLMGEVDLDKLEQFINESFFVLGKHKK